MTWATELSKIRRMLRDPNGSIWSDGMLRHIYNDVQFDFQNRTQVLEEVTAQRVPQTYHVAYQHDWEYRFASSEGTQFYQCLGQHDEGVFCHRWETQQVAGIAADVSDYGAHFTQSWEAFMSELPGEAVRMRFPSNFSAVKFIAYDEEPIAALSKKQIQSSDPSWLTKSGEPVAYYPYDSVDNSYVLYPRPAAAFYNEVGAEVVTVSSDGVWGDIWQPIWNDIWSDSSTEIVHSDGPMALHADGDSEDSSDGTVAIRTGSFDDSDTGIAIDILDVDHNVFLIYAVTPTKVSIGEDEPDYPEFLRKYIRFGVISRAYGGNNDGRIRSLSEFWGGRYLLGVQLVKRYIRNRRNDRDYRLTTKCAGASRSLRHPRLPDGYPAV